MDTQYLRLCVPMQYAVRVETDVVTTEVLRM